MRIVIGGDAWNGLLSPDATKVAVGRGNCRVFDTATGAALSYPVSERSRGMGWLDTGLTLAVQQYEDDCSVMEVSPGAAYTLALGQNIQRAAAGSGHWCGGYAADRRVVWDGQLVEDEIDWHCGGEGEWCVILSETNLHIYKRGVFQRSVQHGVTRDYAIVRDGYCGIGRNGPPLLIELTTGSTVDATATPWRQECEPVYSQGWVCTVTEKPEPMALVRPLGALDVIALPVPEGAVGCDFRVVGDRGVVVTWSDRGQCVIQDCDLTAPRRVLDPLPVAPPAPPPIVNVFFRPPTGTAPINVEAQMFAQTGSGPITAIRWLRDGAIDGGNDVETHTYELHTPGFYALGVRVAGPGGIFSTAPLAYTVTAPAVVTPPVTPPGQGFRLGLCADWMQDEYFAHRVAAGVRVQRLSIGKDAAASDAIIAKFARFPQLTPLYIVRPGNLDELLRVPPGAMVEFGNESNIGDGPAQAPKLSSQQYASMAYAADAMGHTVYWGCPSSIYGDGLKWLKDVLTRCPWMERVSIHDYDRLLTAARLPALLAVLNGRRFRVTEVGVLCGPKGYKVPGGFLKGPKYLPITEQEQLTLLRKVVAVWRAVPTCDGVDIYQENSGATETTSFGLNDPAGKPRLAWGVFQET